MPTQKTSRGITVGGKTVDPASLAVKEGEDPWTAGELQEAVDALQSEVDRLSEVVVAAESDLTAMMRNAGDGAGDDQADVGTKTLEWEQEMSLANNQRDLLNQSERALERIADGTYGRCEVCGEPIGKLRLEAFPRATLCLADKQRQERR